LELALVAGQAVAAAAAAGIADLVVLEGSHKEGKVREESLVQGEDTSLGGHHKA
jgi:hypothetical protein